MNLQIVMGDGIREVVGFGGNWDLVFEGMFSWDVKEEVISLVETWSKDSIFMPIKAYGSKKYREK